MNRSWLYIFIGALFEVGWVIGFKHAGDPLSWVATVAALAVSFYLVIRASLTLPVGTVYAVFTGLGTAGTVIAEMTIFDEPVQLAKIVLIAMLLAGVLGLKLSGDAAPSKEATN